MSAEPAGELDLEAVRRDPKRANIVYHDAAARGYDDKWSISFDDRCIRYVRERAERMLPARRYGRVLEVGAGTGFFLLNLWQAGYVDRPHATDISPGMLGACAENARRLGCDLGAQTGDAEDLPFPDGSFDLVIGHAFLHHLPDPEAALREAHRVLARGGAVWFAGEPTTKGDRRARAIGKVTSRTVRSAARLAPGLGRPEQDGDVASEEDRILSALEWNVDLHTFDPAGVEAMAARAGFERVRTETEELASSVFGWMVRTVEAEVRPGLLGRRWAFFAYRWYLRLYAVDRVLSRFVPKDRFYNLLLYGEKHG